MVIVYFNVQGVVDPRDGHCLLYNTLYNYIDLCESMGLRVTFGSTPSPNNQIFFYFYNQTFKLNSNAVYYKI
jgi:hypothetical protein